MNESIATTVAGLPPAATTSQSQTIYEFARVAMLDGWWVWALLVAATAIAIWACIRHYRRDVAELSRPVRWTLVTMRLVTIAALIFFFFDLQRRTQRSLTRQSEVVILIDTSQSMSLSAGGIDDPVSRGAVVTAIMDEADLAGKFAAEHRVSVYAFDTQSEPRLLQTRSAAVDGGAADPADTLSSGGPGRGVGPTGADRVAWLGVAVIATGLTAGLLALLIGAAGRAAAVGGLLLTSGVCLVVGIVTLGSVYAVRSDRTLASILGRQGPGVVTSADPPADDPPTGVPVAGNKAGDDDVTRPDTAGGDGDVDWASALAAAGSESRIGDALTAVLGNHEPSTLAGVIVMTDGQNNGGSDTAVALATARRSEVSIYPVGLGSSDPPINVRVVDLDAPKRIYPGDKFVVSAVLQASGPREVEVDVQLLDELDTSASGKPTVAPENETESSGLPAEVIQTRRVKLANDGSLSGIRFEIEPESVGRRRVAVRVVTPPGDTNARDDARDARYEVVSRKLRVLAIAGGPTREYRFVRNLLHRDESVDLDVWLQTGQPGMSQDANRVLTEFPKTPQELFQYDAMIVFDPNWDALGAESIELMERWLSQQAAGLVLVAGPVYHPQWFGRRTDPRVAKVAGFFPVELSTRGAILGGGRAGGENAWPLEFTAEAQRAEFLWIAGQGAESFRVWQEFGGVYDYVGVKGEKPGAKVYAYYSDPTTRISDTLPIFMASQFYGAGRTFFQSSGEMWRLRGGSDAYFDSYYTKLIRWVSEGRLLRDSNRGILLLDNSRAMVGDTIVIRAVLTDDQFEPLQVPDVPIKLLTPGGRIIDMKLPAIQGEARGGTYGGRFVVQEAGSYEVRLTIGDALNEEVLSQSVQVRLPTVELERPQRNDAQLRQLAELTSGQYVPVDADTKSGEVGSRLTAAITPQPQTSVLPGTPEREFTQRRNAVLLWLIATVLTFEWVTRRLHRLA